MSGGESLRNKVDDPPVDHPAGCGNKRTKVGVYVLLAVAVLLVFGRTLRYEFVNYDDGPYVYENVHVTQGLTLDGIGWSFIHSVNSNWHPLTMMSHMLDCQFYGLNAGGHHFTNVLLHGATAILLFLVLRRMLGLRSNKSIGATTPQVGLRPDTFVGATSAQAGTLWPSAFVAALFALHPLHVESVAWISERNDVLSGLLFMLTLLMYVRYVEKSKVQGPKSKACYGLTLLFFALGLMSKPTVVTLPFVLLLLDYWPLNRFELSLKGFLRLVFEKLPFFALSAAACAATLLAQKKAIFPLPISLRISNAVVSYVTYLGQMFYPVRLTVLYPYPEKGLLPPWKIILALVLLAGISAGVLRLRRTRPYLLVGWMWYLGMLVPMIGLIQSGLRAHADRYTYLPFIGVFIMLAWGAGEAFQRWRLPAPPIWGIAMLILAACSARTMDQLSLWQNSGTLFRHNIAVTKNNALAYYNLGEYCFTQGRTDETIDNYRKAIQIQPGYDDALNNLGVALAQKGELDEAVARIRESIHYRPDRADAYYNLGNVFVMQHRLDDAADAYTEALRLKPNYPGAHNNLANVLLTQGHQDAAIRHYQEALRWNPNHEGAKRQLRSLGLPVE
jgi:protein O-mannosyl-transferase